MSIFICPSCKNQLDEEDKGLYCPSCNEKFSYNQGILDFLVKKDLLDDKRIKYFDKIASIYETPIFYHLLYRIYGGFFVPSVKKEVKKLTAMLGIKEGTVLDVACGTGIFTRAIANKVSKVYGLDISLEMLKKNMELWERLP